MSNRSEAFGRLLKAGIGSIVNCEGKTAPAVEEDLGQQSGVAPNTIQRYKAGYLPPESRTVEILATACVQRGFMNRDWVQQFLHAARYPTPEKLIDRLTPAGPTRPRPPRIYQNLPAPTYSQFVMRETAFNEVVEGLNKRTAVVLIVGLGGNGKTSLAREVAAHCLREDAVALHFDAVVWVSDKDRSGTTNLSVVLDEIARTLDYPGFTQFAFEEKRWEVEQLLRRQRVLVVVDNFETITDSALLSWLLNLPEPSKALITTREYRREWRSSWPIELRGMSEAEAWELITERVRVLKIERLVGDHAALEPLLVVTGGNPKALTMTIGLLKYERRPLQQIVDDIYAAHGTLFDDLFDRAWALLDEAARRTLLVATFFASSASGKALSASADVQGYAFDRAVERLIDLGLLDAYQENLTVSVRYTVHPLVRIFAQAKLVRDSEFEKRARQRWIGWYSQLGVSLGGCFEDPHRLYQLDPESEEAYTVIKWMAKHQQYTELLKVTSGFSHYYYVRGLWERRRCILQLAEVAAHNQGDILNEAYMLSLQAQLLSKQWRISEAESCLSKATKLTQGIQLPQSVYSMLQHARGLCYFAKENLSAAQKAWKEELRSLDQSSKSDISRARRWIATCLYKRGDVEGARYEFEELLKFSVEHELHVSVAYIMCNLALIDMDQGNVKGASHRLRAGKKLVNELQHRQYTANILMLFARLHTLRGDLPAAREALTKAIDLFERLGMRRELAEARDELATFSVADTDSGSVGL